MHMVNQQTLADQLGLSRATVSRCFTNHRAINPATRARVFDLAAQLGYRYMELRTPVARKAKGTAIGVLVCYAGTFRPNDRFENPGQNLLDGVSELAQLRNVHLDVHYVDPSEQSLLSPSYQKISALRRGRWRGALLIYSFPEKVVDSLSLRFPCVSLVEQYGRADLNCVDVDHYRGVSKIINLLTDLGHRRIGFFSTHLALDTQWAMHRFSAYFEKLFASGLDYNPDDVVNVARPAISEEEAQSRMHARTKDGVTAWVCAADYSAYSAINYLTAQGMKIPVEVSVTGFDGIKPPTGSPAATTLDVPFREIGMTGARRLLDLIKTPFDPPQHILLDCKVRHGQTVGAAPPAKRRTRAA